jgi:hypothetical protein
LIAVAESEFLQTELVQGIFGDKDEQLKSAGVGSNGACFAISRPRLDAAARKHSF